MTLCFVVEASAKINQMPQLLRILCFFSLLYLLPLLSYAQKLSGWTVDLSEEAAITGVHVVNKTTHQGTVSDDKGWFEIALQWGDTVVFSNISYKYYYFVYRDSASALQGVLIPMEEQNYLLNEVSIFSYKLSSNKDVEMKIKEPLYPSNKELRDGNIIRASVANPAEFLYNLFGSKPRQLRMLAQLRAEDAYRDKLQESNNRESVINLTGLSKAELEAFMFYCKYSPVHMKAMSDYDFLLSVQYCYHQYVKERELEEFLLQFD